MTTIQAAAFHSGHRCEESELLPPSAACPFCEFAGERKPGLQLQQAPDVQLLLCPACGAASASRMPKAETLAAYYGTYYSDDTEAVTFDQPLRFAAHVLRIVPRFPGKELRILDFGGGGGALSAAAAKLLLRAGARTVEIVVVDYHQPEASTTAGVVIRHAGSLAEIGPAQFDLVLASAIVEHLPDPRPELLRLFAAVAPGGAFYARTPWIVPVMRLLVRTGVSMDFTYPAHLHDLGRDFWSGILGHLALDSQYRVRHNATSIVETVFSEAPIRTVTAYALKLPSRLFPAWPFVGGWEVVFERPRE